MAKIRHVAISTEDPEKTAAWYKEVFGLEEVGKSPNGVYLSDGEINFAVLRIKSKEKSNQGHANADVTFDLSDGGGSIHTAAQISGKAASMGEGVVFSVLDGLITDFTRKLANI
jgi:catechol 2,3-dioxygenase-like lactoylglutathione lyase family enzyme